MKQWVSLLLMTALLSGCGAEATFETVADDWAQPVMASPARISVALPGETALPVMESDFGRVYVCNDYTIALQTLEGGDLGQTLHTVCGLSREDLTVVETFAGAVRRHEFVWAAAGERGDQTGRAVILDDGNYHYCLSVLRSAEGETQIDWDQVFASFALVSY